MTDLNLDVVMKTFTNDDIRKWEPCYDPDKYYKEDDVKHTVLTILDDKRIPFEDRLWVICRDDLVSDKLMRLFAVWCARQVQHLMKDERSIKAIDVAERFAHGEATREELMVARDAAGAVARGAAWDAARDAAWDAARDAARAAVWAAARAAAGGAAWDAAGDAARAAAGDAAGDAARAAQESKLREMLIAGIETGDVI